MIERYWGDAFVWEDIFAWEDAFAGRCLCLWRCILLEKMWEDKAVIFSSERLTIKPEDAAVSLVRKLIHSVRFSRAWIQCSCLSIPETGGLVTGRRCQPRSVGRESHRVDPVCMPLERLDTYFHLEHSRDGRSCVRKQDASRCPSGSNATELAPSVCSSRVWVYIPVTASQRQSVSGS